LIYVLIPTGKSTECDGWRIWHRRFGRRGIWS